MCVHLSHVNSALILSYSMFTLWDIFRETSLVPLDTALQDAHVQGYIIWREACSVP